MPVEIIVACIAAVPALLVAIPAVMAAKRAGRAETHARNADDAVNHRAPGEARLVDMVAETHAMTVEQGERLHVLEGAFLHHLVYDHTHPVGGEE